MSLFSWLPFGRKEPSAEPSEGLGMLTGCVLSDTAALTRPFVRDPFYRLRPPFSPEAVKRSLELAHTAYTLELNPWKSAGWNDFSILIDDDLLSGLGRDGVKSRFKLFRARAALREWNPISQISGALRQRERSDTVKAVCMMKPDGEGHFLVAIGFMGTGGRFYDWFSNLRFTPEEGFHRGFYQLCESFELNTEEIEFPSAAAALGLEKLTLGEVFSEMRSLSSRFRLWMAGHSQGAAVMQVLTHRLITDWGVLAQNMTGYGFASPTVATGKFVYDPAAYPLCHILNRDDPVTRMGALLHLGLCMEFEPDNTFRQAVYGWNEKDAALRESFRFVQESLQDMPSALTSMTALLEVLAEEKGAEGLNELLTSRWAVPAVDRVLWRAGDRAMDWLDGLLSSARDTHQLLTGRRMDENELTGLRRRIRPLVQNTSLRGLLDVLNDLGVAPHRLDGAYAAITAAGEERLKPFIWIKASAGLPVRRWSDWQQSAWPPPALPAPARAKRQKAIPYTTNGKWRVSYSARRRNPD